MQIDETKRLGMPLLKPAQAQKHVTVNEALMRLDGLVNLVLQSVTVTTPPVVVEGQCWGVPLGAVGAWAGHGRQIAIGSNGGWIFVPASVGMRGFVADRGMSAIFSGSDWITGALTMGAFGSGLQAGILENEVIIGKGIRFDTGVTIPAHAMVIGVTARVVEPLTGTVKSWRLGSPGEENRFGSGLGVGKGSWGRGTLGAPHTYYNPAPLIMTAEGGSFTGGRVRLGVHWLEIRLPD